MTENIKYYQKVSDINLYDNTIMQNLKKKS